MVKGLRGLLLVTGALGVVSSNALAQMEVRGQFVALPNSHTYSLAVGDFNHDGALDVAVVSDCCEASGVSILLGRGDGTFEPPVQYAVGSQPFSIVAADFNHDGNLDLAIANSLSPYVSILIGNGDGTFQPATQTPNVDNPLFVSVGDFNQDGETDLISLCSNDTIAVLFGNGDGTFQPAITTQPSFSVGAIGIGDFDGDGILDLATAGTFGTKSEVNILLGNGDGTFRQGASYSGGDEPEYITVADLNGDHRLDFAVANFLGYTVGVWLGNGDGTFAQGVNYSTEAPIGLASAQMDGDRKFDLVAASYDGGVSVLKGNGDGTFQPAVFYPTGREDRFVAVGDFNGDKKPDAVVVDGSTEISLLLNTGVVSFSPTTPLDFKDETVGTTSKPQTVTLTNTGTTALKVSSFRASAEFGVTSTCGSTVAAGANCTISATFSPTKKGAVQGTITVIDSASTKPQVIELLGTGT